MALSQEAQRALDEALAYARAQDWRRAAECFRRAAHLDAAAAEPRFRMGWAIWKTAELAKPSVADLALGYGAQLLGLDAIARERSRKFAVHARMLREAGHWLREAIARDPSHARAHYYLAQTLRQLGYRQEAARVAQKAAQLDPNHAGMAALAQEYRREAGTPSSTSPPDAGMLNRLTWDDVVLPPRTKRELRQMQLMLEKPDLARELGVEPPTGILLTGAPGTGKTTIARVLANEARCRFFSVTPAEINEMYVGESEKRVRELFAKARAAAPSIVFIDEIDALLPARQGGVAIHSDKVVNQFLQEMDGMTPNLRVLVVGATNRPDMLDAAVLRGGRLSREIVIPLPDAPSRLELLKLFTRNVKLDASVDLAAIAAATDGASGADLRAIVNEAGLQALIRIADAGDAGAPRLLTREDFEGAMRNLDLGGCFGMEG